MAAYITAVGNLGRDPETKTVGSGSVTKLVICCNHKDKTGEIATWLNADIWGKSGEAAATYLKKGSAVQVNGEFVARPYKDSNGNERLSLDIKNASFAFVGGKSDAGSSRGEQSRDYNDELPSMDSEIPF